MVLSDKINFDQMSNAEISSHLIELQFQHEAIKRKISDLLDSLDKVEQEFTKGEKTLANRIKPRI